MYFFRKKSGQLLKNFLPTFLTVLSSYCSLYFPVISIDARGTLALLRSFLASVSSLLYSSIISILNVFLLNDGIRAQIPKLGYLTLLDIWICGCFLTTFFIRYLSKSI